MANAWASIFGVGGKFIADKLGKGNGNDTPQVPDFQVDPYYTSSQKDLDTLGTGILSGNLPDYYKNIGQANSPAFQSMLDSIIGKTQQGVNESLAASGTLRSGVAQSATSDALKGIIPNLTYADFLNSQNQQIGLLNTGVGIKQNVNSNARTQESMVNNYGLAKTQMQYNFDQAASQQQGQLFATLLNGGLGAIAGGATGGIPGAIAGGVGGLTGQGNSVQSFMDMLGGINKTQVGSNGASGGTTTGLLDQLGALK